MNNSCIIKKIFWILFVLFLMGFGITCKTQVIYVSSSYGNDTNDGLTKEQPVQTIKMAVSKGNTICLHAGDVFYEYVILKNKKMIRYGEGVNPLICGLREIIGEPWEQVDANIWMLKLTALNQKGYLVVGSSDLNNVGCFYETDKDELHGRKCEKKSELCQDWDFYQSDIQTYKMEGVSCFDNVYLYLSENPNKLSLAITVGSHYGITLNDSSVESINVKGFGTGGMTLLGSSSVRNCRIDIIGGSMMLFGNETVSLGNGIDFWVSKNAYDCIIEDNYITRCYDCGSSIQASKCGDATPSNITFRHNLIAHCCQGWEDFLLNNPTVKFINCRFENNIVVYSGDSGFEYPKTRMKFCNVLGNNLHGDRGMIFKNNRFIGGNFYCGSPYKGKYTSNVWEGNIHYVERGSYLLSNYWGTADVIRIPMFGPYKEIILKYRALTSDKTTVFKVCSESRIDRMSKRAIKKYLKKHKY